jgi:hypothetical protein
MAPPCGLEKFIMLPRLIRILAPLLIMFSMSLPYAAAQSDSSLPSVDRGVKGGSTSGEEKSGSPAAFPYFVMAIYTMLVLTIVCMPSRKA